MGVCKPASSYELLLIGRFLSGLACGTFTGLVPLYVTEVFLFAAPCSIKCNLYHSMSQRYFYLLRLTKWFFNPTTPNCKSFLVPKFSPQIFFSVMASGGLYSLILHHNSQSLIIIFVHWTQLLEWHKLHVLNYISFLGVFVLVWIFSPSLIAGPLPYQINTCSKQDSNLGPMAFSLLEFEIAP